MKIKEKLNVLLRKQGQINIVFQKARLGRKAYSRFPEIILKNSRSFSKLSILLKCFKYQISKINTYPSLELYLIMISKKAISSAYHYFEKHHSLEKLIFVKTKPLAKIQTQKDGPSPQFFLILSARPPPSTDDDLIHIKRCCAQIIIQAKKAKLIGKSINFNNKPIIELLDLNGMKETIVQVLAFY